MRLRDGRRTDRPSSERVFRARFMMYNRSPTHDAVLTGINDGIPGESYNKRI
jgi:hypothetical protein